MTEQESEKKWNEYLYDNSDVLINKFNCTNFEELKKIETTITFQKLLELQDIDYTDKFDKNYLRKIHKYIFGEVYPFAGEYRKVNMMKTRGNFLMMRNIDDIDIYLDELFTRTDIELKSCYNIYQFAEVLSKLYTLLIYCHPFREGNGRCIREFIREFSIVKSKEINFGEYELKWNLIDKEELNKNIEVAHILPGATTILFVKALVDISSNKKM